MKNKIDLHMHSTFSDGTLTPFELAVLAAESGLCAAALTDHDTTEGTHGFVSGCEKLGIEGIAGVEIGAKFKQELHIVGLYVGGKELEAMLTKLRDGRKDRNIRMAEKLREGGYKISVSDICNGRPKKDIKNLGRVHIANALVRKGYIGSVNEAFDKLIGKDKPYYVSRFSLSPEECVRLIKRSGGVAVWAHPIYAVSSEKEMVELADRLKAAGLDAMECFYSRYSDEEMKMCMKVSEEAGLLMSGGSDFHGANKPDVKLGHVSGGYVSYEILEKLKERIGKSSRAVST